MTNGFRHIIKSGAMSLLMGIVCSQVNAEPLHPSLPQPEGVAWPTEEWAIGEIPLAADHAVLNAALKEAFSGPHEHLGITHAAILVHNGRIVFEGYGEGISPDTPLVSWSMAKSVTQALVGRALHLGLIDTLERPMPNPYWDDHDPRSDITWRQWLQMTDGLHYLELGAPDITVSHVGRLIYGAGRMDVAAFASSLPLIHPPGTHWNYSTAGYALIGMALGNLIDSDPHIQTRWMKENFFDVIGMKSAQPEFDPAGTFIGGSLVYATARDWARFGYLYLREGVWEEDHVLPEDWVSFARRVGPAGNADIYGAGWWLTPEEGAGVPRRSLFDDEPRDAYSAQGFEGQMVVVVPSKDLVIVKLGVFVSSDKDWAYFYDWAERIAQSFPDADDSAKNPPKVENFTELDPAEADSGNPS